MDSRELFVIFSFARLQNEIITESWSAMTCMLESVSERDSEKVNTEYSKNEIRRKSFSVLNECDSYACKQESVQPRDKGKNVPFLERQNE